MPELPEVETVRAGLAPVLEGRVLTQVIQRRADLRFPFPDNFSAQLEGRRVERLARRSKYLLAHLEGGLVLIAHLGMSGRFTVLGGTGAPVGRFVHAASQAGDLGHGPHDHVVFETDAGMRVVYTDPRRFGFMLLTSEADLAAHKFMAGLGVEPLDPAFDAGYLQARFKTRHAPLKAGLLDQKIVCGLGNIYVCEALHRARLSPRRSCHTVGPARAARLVPAIQDVIREAIAAGGSSLRDYAAADGSLGYFQHGFAVYGRAGAPCPRPGCGTVMRIVQSGRSTFFCPHCQR